MTGCCRLRLMTHVCWDPWIKSNSSSHRLYFKPNKSLWWKRPYPDFSGLENHIQGKANFLPEFPPAPAAAVPWSAQYTSPDPECSLVPSDEVLLPPWLSSPASCALGFQWTQTQKGTQVMTTERRGVSFLEGKREHGQQLWVPKQDSTVGVEKNTVLENQTPHNCQQSGDLIPHVSSNHEQMKSLEGHPCRENSHLCGTVFRICPEKE